MPKWVCLHRSILMLCNFPWHIKYAPLYTHSSLKAFLNFISSRTHWDFPSFWWKWFPKSHHHLTCLCLWTWKTRRTMRTLKICTWIDGPGLRKREKAKYPVSFCLRCWSLIPIKWDIRALSDASNPTSGPIIETFRNKGVNNPGRFTCLPSADGL